MVSFDHVVRGATDIDIYIDCNNAGGSYSGSGSTQVAYSNVPGSLGRKDANTGGPPWYFNGSIDDFSFWNRALTEPEVQSLCAGILDVEESFVYSESLFSVYPNPAADQLTINSADVTRNMMVQLMDFQGRIVLQEALVSSVHALELSEVSSGLLLCRVIDVDTDEVVSQSRVVKQ